MTHHRHGMSNADQPWDDFDPQFYFRRNYASLLDADQRILRVLAEFFESQPLRGVRGIDVGTGSNLYPAMAMLPLCDEVTMWERSRNNVEWLIREKVHYRPSWDRFWAELSRQPSYQAIGDPRSLLADRARPRRGDVFQLPEHAWDVGTMFFVAESMTALHVEFEAALHAFVRSLRHGAPFAAAFMENSDGYLIQLRHDDGAPPAEAAPGEEAYTFPAVPIGVDDVARGLAAVAHNVDIQRIDRGDKPLREGYTGMIVAVGTAGPRRGA